MIVNLASGDADSSVFFIKMDSNTLEIFSQVNYGRELNGGVEQETDHAIMVLTV
jgi:hypothetical protein